MVRVTSAPRNHRLGQGQPQWLAIASAGALGLAALVGAAIATDRIYLAIAVAILPLAILILRTDVGRLIVFTLGGLLVLGRRGSVTTPEIGFMGLAVCLSLVARVRCQALEYIDYVRTSLNVQVAMAAGLSIWAGIGLSRGAALGDVARDSVAYVLVAIAIPIGLAAGITGTHRAIRALVYLSSFAAAVSFTIALLANRGVGRLSISSFALPSLSLIALGVAISAADARSGRRAAPLLSGFTLIGAVLITGTRTGIVLVFGLLYGLVSSGPRRTGRLRIVFQAAVVGAMVVGLFALLAPSVVDPSFLLHRIASLGQGIASTLQNDKSAVERRQKYALASHLFMEHPMIGQGFGVVRSDRQGGGFYLDTPVLFLAKFGLIGTVLLLGTLGVVLLPRASKGRRSSNLVQKTFMITLLLLLPFSAILEDKGFAVAVALVVAMSALGISERGAPSERRSGAP